ncbi:MAG: hypothetical protein ABWX96_06435 [Propionibacteriaceae bacterium]
MSPPLSDQDAAVSAPEGWVPVDRRWHGLDRAAFPYALTVLALALILAVVVPWIDQQVPGGTRVRAGDQVGLQGGVVFSPAVDWTLTNGILVGAELPAGGYPNSAEVDRGPVSFSVTTTNWPGTPVQLLEQLTVTTDASSDRRALHVTGSASTFTTVAGQRGVLARYRSTTVDGLIAALVLNGTGVAVVVTGPVDVPENPSNDVVAMLTSFHSTKEVTR